MFFFAGQLLLILAGVALLSIKICWPQLFPKVITASFRPSLKGVLKGVLRKLLLPAFSEEAFFRGFPWLVFLAVRFSFPNALGLGSETAGLDLWGIIETAVAALSVLICFLSFNLAWAAMHPYRPLWPVFAIGLIFQALLCWSGNILIPIAAHVVMGSLWLTYICFRASTSGLDSLPERERRALRVGERNVENSTNFRAESR